MKRIVFLLATILLLASPIFASQTWYVRADGGTRKSANVTSGQCDGLSDLAAAGAVSNHCAFSEFRYMWDDDSGAVGAGAWVIAGGDTVVVRGCSANANQVNPANPTCRIGWDNGNGGGPTNLWCQFVGNNACYNPPIPAGSAGAHTRIIGGCVLAGNCNSGTVTNRSNLTQLFGGFGLTWTFNLKSTQYVDIQGIYLTTHNKVMSGTFTGQNCTHGGSPGYPTSCSTSSPLDDFADNGFVTNNTTSNILFQDVIVDGMASSGFWGPIGGPITLTRVQSSFNGGDGWNFDDGSDTPDAAGSQIIASYLTMNGNGCYEEYPIVHAFPARACYDGNASGAGGDTFSGQDTTLDVLTCDHCTFAYNTKDAYIGPHTQITTNTITNSTSYGNMGANWKWGATLNSTVLFQNNLTVGNCLRMNSVVPGASQTFNLSSGLGGAYLSVFCRAGGAQFAVITRSGSSNQYIGNTVIGASNIIFQENCGFYSTGNVFNQETNCGSVPNLYKVNNFLGYNDPGIGDFPALYFAETASIHFTGSFSNEFGMKSGTGDTCGTNNITCVSPLLTSQPTSPWPGSEAALDVFNASAGSGNSFYPTGSSPLLAAGTTITGLTTDYYATTRPSPPAMGAVELAGTPTVATPTASPAAGSYTSTQSVTLSTVTAGATICYTMGTSPANPTAPTPGTCGGGSTTYSGAISVSATTTIKALGTLVGDLNSGVFTGLYTITLPAAPTVTTTNVKLGGTVVLQ